MTATEPSSSTRTRSRGVLILIGCVVLVCIAWSAAWVYAANRVEKEVDLWIEREAKLGRNWSCTERGLAGFPFRLALNCREPVLETTSGEPVRVTMAAAQSGHESHWCNFG